MELKEKLQKAFDRAVKIMGLEEWNLKLEFIEKDWKNTGNVKVDIENKTAIVFINIFNPKMENLEEVIIHELTHVKLWKLDQYCESLLNATFEDKNSKAYNFAYDQFMTMLETTTQEIAKTYVKCFAEDKTISTRRCETTMPFKESKRD